MSSFWPTSSILACLITWPSDLRFQGAPANLPYPNMLYTQVMLSLARNAVLASNVAVYENTRFVNARRKDGSTWSRHYAESLQDCFRICKEAYPGCSSVNFGSYDDTKMCELLTVQASKANFWLASWLKDTPGWAYACCA